MGVCAEVLSSMSWVTMAWHARHHSSPTALGPVLPGHPACPQLLWDSTGTPERGE